MAAGAVNKVLVCVPVQTGGAQSVAPCLDANGQHYQPGMLDAYLIDPASAPVLDNAMQPYDSAQGLQFFSFAFGTVLTFWLIAHGIGQLLHLIRTGR